MIRSVRRFQLRPMSARVSIETYASSDKCDARERSLIGKRQEVLGSIPRRRRAAASELGRPSLLLLEVMPFRLAGTLTFL